MHGHLLSEEGRLGAGDIDEKRDNSASNTKYIVCFNFYELLYANRGTINCVWSVAETRHQLAVAKTHQLISDEY